MRVTFDSRSAFKIDAPQSRGSLDVGDMPHFVAPTLDPWRVVRAVFPHATELTILPVVTAAGAIAAFVRYDLR